MWSYQSSMSNRKSQAKFGHQARKALPQREVLIPLSGCPAGTADSPIGDDYFPRVSVKNGGVSWYITIGKP